MLLVLALSTAVFVLISLILYACWKEHIGTPAPLKEKQQSIKRKDRRSVDNRNNEAQSSNINATAMIAARR